MIRGLVLSGPIALASVLHGQGIGVGDPGSAIRTGTVYQTYVIGSGLAFDRITQLVVPAAWSQRLGSRLTMDISTAYVAASVRTTAGPIELSGLVDTDIRAALAIVPGRLILTLVGTVPTGQETVADTTLPLYGTTATDLFGFMAPTFGGGGAITGGFATAFRVGDSWAVGTGFSYRHAAPYLPVAGGDELEPGGEGRLRLGVEGPLSGRTYFRGAIVYTASARDQFSSGTQSAIGDRVLVYGTLNLPVGRGALSLYAWDMRRLRPREFGAGVVAAPRGNVVALGAKLERPLSPSLLIVPALELRHELSGYESLDLLGYLIRPGVDLKWRVSSRAALVLQGHVAFGRLQDEGTTVSLLGPRVGAMLEWTR